MSRRFLIAVLFFFFASGAVAQATQADVFPGHWRQVASNAGQCGSCTLTVTSSEGGYQVASSNGWNALVLLQDKNGRVAFVGTGRWLKSPPRIDPHPPLVTHFAIRDERLHLVMLLTRPNGTIWQIRAVFEREVPVA